METSKRVCLSLLVVVAIAMVSFTVVTNLSASGKPDAAGVINIGEQEKAPAPKDPCWFMSLKDKSITYEMIKERQDRDMHGYPTEIALSEAIRVFNEEKACLRLLARYPPLTEDELIAAIVAGPDHGKQGQVWVAQKDALWKIASQKVMPRGSLLVTDGGYRILDSPLRPLGTIQAKGIRITLLLGLEHSEHGALLKPEQTLLVRKTFTGVETVK